MAERTFISFDWAIKKVLKRCFFKKSEIKDEFTAKGMTEAKQVLRYENMEWADQEAYKRHIENRRIEMGVMETAIDRAKRAQSIEVAKEALKEGASIEFVTKITKLPLIEIEKLANGEDIDNEEDT